MNTPATAAPARPVNFAVIGCGALARSTHLPNLARSPKGNPLVACDLSDDLLEQCRRDFGVERTTHDFAQAIADPDVDAVCLCTTEALRLPVVKAAAAAGKAVYCEKPLAATLEEMYEIQRVVQQSGIPFCVGHNRRSSPAMLEAHRIFRGHMADPKPCPWRWDREGERRPRRPDDGVAAISVRINDDWYSWKNWVWDKRQCPHGLMLTEMTHFTDICNWFLASEPVEVCAMEPGPFAHSCAIRYAGGELANITQSASGTFGYPKELYEVMGHGAMVVIDHMAELRIAGIEGAPPHVTFPLGRDDYPEVGQELGLSGWLAKRREGARRAMESGNPTALMGAEVDKGHARMLDRFIDQIRGNGPIVCPVEAAVLATRVCFAALRSAHERRFVALEEI